MSLVEDKVSTASKTRRGMDTLFTSTETIADKLINNWLALFMFSYLKGLDVVDEDGQVYLRVNVLDVDSVQQTKQKVLDSIWRNGYCFLPRDLDAIDLVWIQSHEKSILLHDSEGAIETHGKVMVKTMKSYGIGNGCRVALIPKQHGIDDTYQALNVKEISSDIYESLVNMTAKSVPEPDLSQQPPTAIHLKDVEQPATKESAMPEYIQQKKANFDRNLAIPHMLTMKASISPYVDGIFEVMFKKPAKLPLPVKHLFDTFDQLAMKYAEEASPEACADKWKKNCLCNFWGSVLTNLPSLFEMPRSETADRCTSILSDALHHATRTISLRRGESDHLPYYKEHPLQRRMVTNYCTEIASQPKVRQGKLNSACSTVSKEYKGQFSHLSNMLHLYNLTKDDVESLLK